MSSLSSLLKLKKKIKLRSHKARLPLKSKLRKLTHARKTFKR